ncbi:hypothetical protein [Oceanobacillus kimchii]|nr:hypothetical protein [Oceanobacillus kimchii]
MPSRVLPSLHLITSVHGLCFQDGKLLMIDLKQRGYIIIIGMLFTKIY